MHRTPEPGRVADLSELAVNLFPSVAPTSSCGFRATVDSDPLCSPFDAFGWLLGQFFSPSSFVFGQTRVGKQMNQGHHIDSAVLIASELDVVTKETKECDCVQGFQLCQSVGGGTVCAWRPC